MKILKNLTVLILVAILVLTAVTAVSHFIYKSESMFSRRGLRPDHVTSVNDNNERLKGQLKFQAASVKNFVKSKYNSKVCFLINMNLPSGKNRFFVYDMEKDSILAGGLVAHGSCDNGFQETPTFSNKANTGCSCFGKFKVGNSYEGRFGVAYKLHGLDSSNSNAYERNIVLHSYRCVPDEETEPIPICNSRGCPMVSPAFLEKLKVYLDKSERPILLEIFN